MKYQKITKVSKNSEQNNLENDNDNETPKERQKTIDNLRSIIMV